MAGNGSARDGGRSLCQPAPAPLAGPRWWGLHCQHREHPRAEWHKCHSSFIPARSAGKPHYRTLHAVSRTWFYLGVSALCNIVRVYLYLDITSIKYRDLIFSALTVTSQPWWWADPSWLPDPHPAVLSLPPSRTRGENKTGKKEEFMHHFPWAGRCPASAREAGPQHVSWLLGKTNTIKLMSPHPPLFPQLLLLSTMPFQ